MRIWRCQTFILFRQNPFLIKLFCEKLSNKTHLRVHHHNFQYSSSPGTLWLMIPILHHMRHQAPGPLLSPRRSHPKLDIMTKWLNAPPLWNVFIAITTPSPVPSQVWIFKQHLIHSSPPPHLTLSTLSGQPRSVKGVPLSKFDSSHSSTIYWPGLILLNIVTISTWWILFPCTFDVRFRAVNKSFTVSREGIYWDLLLFESLLGLS